MKTDDLIRSYIYIICIENTVEHGEHITYHPEVTKEYITHKEKLFRGEIRDPMSNGLTVIALRARMNSHRNPEIYVLASESSLDFDELYNNKPFIELVKQKGIKYK